jgi:hypothetical protein
MRSGLHDRRAWRRIDEDSSVVGRSEFVGAKAQGTNSNAQVWRDSAPRAQPERVVKRSADATFRIAAPVAAQPHHVANGNGALLRSQA